jgi:gliding motility-associated lipoprotein GldB
MLQDYWLICLSLFNMNNTVKFFQIYLFFICLPAFFSCRQSDRPNVEDVKINIRIERFDKDMAAAKGKPLEQTHTQLARKYGYFYQDYVNHIVGNGSFTGPEILNVLYNDQAYSDLSHEADSVFQDMKPIEQDLTKAFKYIKYYYPQIRTPRFVAFISGFEVQTPIGDGYMGLGLDMFLGRNSRFYPAIVRNVPLYISRRFTPEYVVPRLVETFAREELFPERDEDRTLIAKMIHNGKILYFMDQILEEQVPDSVKIGYTDKQLGWCSTYEGNIWGFFMENELLFNTDYQKIQVYLSEGPFTPGLGEKNQSAPKLGVWMGWQIVRKYMKENPDVSLQDLMTDTDAEKILRSSKYKPRQK